MSNPERVKADVVSKITGYSVRQVQNMAALGKIPSAARPGKIWTFDELRVRRWMKEKEREIEIRRLTSTSVKARGTRAVKLMAPINDEAYEQALRPSRSRGSAGS